MSRSTFVFALIAMLAVGGRAAEDPFEVTTPGAPGTGGVVPTLVGEGPATPNSANTLFLADAAPSASALLVFSMSELAAPFAGGVLGPAPDFVASLGATDARGALERRFRMRPDAPAGLELFLQAWVSDAGAVAGLSASNTVKATVPPSANPAALFPGAILPLSGGSFSYLISDDLDGDGRDDLMTLSQAHDTVAVSLAGEDGLLCAPLELALTGPPSAMAAGDFDGDGAMDLAVTSDEAEELSIHLGQGDGSFVLAGALPWTFFLGAPVAADLDGDGLDDLLTIHAATVGADAFIAVLLSLGDATFGAPIAMPIASTSSALATGDFDADGQLDVVVVNSSQDTLSVHLGQGDGTLGAPSTFPTGNFPAIEVVRDMNADGHLDVVTLNSLGGGSGELELHFGDGVGGFAASPTVASTKAARDVAAADVDADGFVDLVVSERFAMNPPIYQITVLFGSASGDFQEQPPFLRFGATTGLLAPADFDGDGVVDVACVSIGNGVLQLFGEGDGTFGIAPRQGVGSFKEALALGDVDGNDVLDLVAAGGDIVIRLGLGDGSFGPQVSIPSGVSAALVELDDFDGDGALDIVVGGTFFGGAAVITNGGAAGWAAPELFLEGVLVSGLATGDLTGDGLSDIAVASRNPPEILILPSLGDAGFGAPITVSLGLTAGEAGPQGLRCVDMDDDGDLDLVLTTTSFADSSATVAVVLGNGDGSFAAPTHVDAGIENWIGTSRLAVGDLDGDTIPDVVMPASPQPSEFSSLGIVYGTPDGGFSPVTYLETTGYVTSIAIGDVSGDGIPDITTTGFNEALAVHTGRPGGGFESPVLFAAGTNSNSHVHADLDADGDTDIAVLNTGSKNVWLYQSKLSALQD